MASTASSLKGNKNGPRRLPAPTKDCDEENEHDCEHDLE